VLYGLDFEASSHTFYPDAAGALRALHERGRRVAVGIETWLVPPGHPGHLPRGLERVLPLVD
jgi:hypothetical protein